MDAVHLKAKYTLNDTGLLGDDVEYSQLVSKELSVRFFKNLFKKSVCLWHNWGVGMHSILQGASPLHGNGPVLFP